DAGIHLNLYRDDALYVERVTPECEWYCAQARIEPRLADDLERLHDGVTKLVAIAQPDLLDLHEILLKQSLQGEVYVVRSTPRYLEFAAAGTSKAIALRELAGRLGVADGEIIAFGDADNDAQMLEMAGLGVSVGEASLAARQAADRHAAVIGLGVAEVLEEVFA
ncbi:MAG: HAD hydrolase family protein, partial [Candidatus Sericytochromatia bacterium]|nr:HAD hydrolase family protein [Candidatus Tanganyikabacteria bacterium]